MCFYCFWKKQKDKIIQTNNFNFFAFNLHNRCERFFLLELNIATDKADK